MSDILRLNKLSAHDESRTLLKDVSLELGENETIAFIGESGSGKTITLKAILGLLPDDIKRSSGSVEICGKDIYSLSKKEKRKFLGSHVGFVAQNTVNYLHPLLRVGDQMTDGYITFNGKKSKKEAYEKAAKLLSSVGIQDPERVLSSYPSQLSGGMRQRVNIATALMMDPNILLSDEPTTALDKVIQKQVIELYLSLLKERSLSLVLVSHDLYFVNKIADKIAVFYSGQVVEIGTKDEVLNNPLHPYTKALLALSPSMDMDKKKPLNEIKGYISEEDRLRVGCPFLSRCPCASKKCEEEISEIFVTRTHGVKCTLIKEEL